MADAVHSLLYCEPLLAALAHSNAKLQVLSHQSFKRVEAIAPERQTHIADHFNFLAATVGLFGNNSFLANSVLLIKFKVLTVLSGATRMLVLEETSYPFH